MVLAVVKVSGSSLLWRGIYPGVIRLISYWLYWLLQFHWFKLQRWRQNDSFYVNINNTVLAKLQSIVEDRSQGYRDSLQDPSRAP